MDVITSESRPSRRGPDSYFTGTVWLDEIAHGIPPAHVRVLRVSFEPGARTNWHTHPLGQILHVLSGRGRVQLEGEPPREILPGDTVRIAAGERHWHGAGPDHTFVHLAIQEVTPESGETVWLEPVAEADYRAQPGQRAL